VAPSVERVEGPTQRWRHVSEPAPDT
jgi:hypothetical protein